MSAIGKGDWVQCIDPDCDDPLAAPAEVVCGGVYVVDYMTPPNGCAFCKTFGPGFELVGFPSFGDGTAWCPCQFRPLGGNAKTLTAPPARICEPA